MLSNEEIEKIIGKKVDEKLDEKFRKKKKKKYTPKTKYAKEWLTMNEIDQMMNYKHLSEENEFLIRLTYDGALRISEAIMLRVKDFREEEEGKFYLFLGKTKTDNRPVLQPIRPYLLKYYNRYIENKNMMGIDFLFPPRKQSLKKQLDRSSAYRIINRIAKGVGIPKQLGTHTLRRSRALHLLQNGIDISIVSKFLRHARITTTMEYLKFEKSWLSEIIQKETKTISY